MNTPIKYEPIIDTLKALEAKGWIAEAPKDQGYILSRYFVPASSPLRDIKHIDVEELTWLKPVVQFKQRKDRDFDKAPTDIEFMAHPANRKFLQETLLPPIENLNDSLLDHSFSFFSKGAYDEFQQPQYQRLLTNLTGNKREVSLGHGRLYPYGFPFPSEKALRAKILIDDCPVSEVDVHASSLIILSNDREFGFELPECDDLYQFGPLAVLNRTLVKGIIQAVINGMNVNVTRWPAAIRNDEKLGKLLEGQRWADYKSSIFEAYPALANLPNDMGLKLFVVESEILISAMQNLLDQGIGCLPLHDCLIVPRHYVEEAKLAWASAYKAKGFQTPNLSVE